MLRELFNYMLSMFKPKHGTCDITIVRRYITPTGFSGELYVDGRQHGVSCDNFIGNVEVFRHPLEIGYEKGHRVLRTDTYVLTSGDFTAKAPDNVCLVGSLDTQQNASTLRRLIDLVKGKQYIRLTVLNRCWAEF